MNEVNINNEIIQYDFIINKKLKKIKLAISINEIKLYSPFRLSKDEILKILKDNENWIYEKFIKFKSVKVHDVNSIGNKLLYKGSYFELKTIEWDKKGAKVHFDNKIFLVNIDARLTNEQKKILIDEAITKLYKQLAKDFINERVKYYSKLIGVKYNDVRIKDQKTRWGSCSGKDNLNFNYRLIMAPQNILDYVVVHELCHIIHKNHSNEFWNEVYKYIEDYKDRIKYLKENGQLYFR